MGVVDYFSRADRSVNRGRYYPARRPILPTPRSQHRRAGLARAIVGTMTKLAEPAASNCNGARQIIGAI